VPADVVISCVMPDWFAVATVVRLMEDCCTYSVWWISDLAFVTVRDLEVCLIRG
jgi:hypothetical protein